MASYFLDTSAIIKNYVTEAGHAWVATLCDAAVGNTIYISQAALVETVAALCRMARTRPRHIGLATRNRLIGEFRRDAAARFVAVNVDAVIYTRALYPRCRPLSESLIARLRRGAGSVRSYGQRAGGCRSRGASYREPERPSVSAEEE